MSWSFPQSICLPHSGFVWKKWNWQAPKFSQFAFPILDLVLLKFWLKTPLKILTKINTLHEVGRLLLVLDGTAIIAHVEESVAKKAKWCRFNVEPHCSKLQPLRWFSTTIWSSANHRRKPPFPPRFLPTLLLQQATCLQIQSQWGESVTSVPMLRPPVSSKAAVTSPVAGAGCCCSCFAQLKRGGKEIRVSIALSGVQDHVHVAWTRL